MRWTLLRSCRRALFDHGKSKADPRPVPERGVEPDPPAVEVHDLLTQGETDAGPGVAVASMEPLEDDEDLFGKPWFDPDPIVGDAEEPLSWLRSACGLDHDFGRSIVGMEFDGVGDQVLPERNQQRGGRRRRRAGAPRRRVRCIRVMAASRLSKAPPRQSAIEMSSNRSVFRPTLENASKSLISCCMRVAPSTANPMY